MVKLSGKGAFQGVNMIVHVPDNGVIKKDGKAVAYYLDAELDQSLKNPGKVSEVADGKNKGAQTDPHLVANRVKDHDGHYWTTHRSWYSAKQADAIMKAAGNKVVDEPGKGKAYGVKANIFANAKKQLVINTSKDMGPSDNKFFGKNTLAKQEAVTKAARELQNSEYEAKHQEAQAENKAPKAAKEASAPIPEAKAPEAPVQQVSEAEAPNDDGPAFS